MDLLAKRQIVILAAFMFLLVQSLTYGETTVSMSPSTVESPAVGQQLSFSINITGGIDVSYFRVTLTFDPTALSYVSISSGGYLGNTVSDDTQTTYDSIRYRESISTGVDGDGTFATVTFTVLEAKDSTIGLSAGLINSTNNLIDKTVEGATITSPQTTGISISIVSSPGSGNPGDDLTYTVEVQEDGTAASGKTVSFSITSGDGNASLNPASATTDTDGQASTTITLGQNASGFYTVTATVDSKSISGAAKVIPLPAEISMSPSSVESPAVGQQLSFSINIKGGIDVSYFRVTLTFDPTALSYVSISSGGYLGNTVSDDTQTTNDSVKYRESISTGVDGDGTFATVTFTVLEAKDSTIGLSAGLINSTNNLIDKTVEGATITSPQTTGISISIVSSPGSGNPGDDLTYTVEVQEDGTAASGKTVSFSITSGDGNASLNPASATTDTDGQASTTITLGQNASGFYTVTATVDSKSISGAAKVIPLPAEISMSPSSVESPAVGQQLSFSINIKGGIDVSYFRVTLTFDPTALSYVSISSGGYLGNTVSDDTQTTNDSIRYRESISTGVNGDGTFATVTFTVLEAKDSTIGLSAGLINSTNNFIDKTVEGAAITSPQTTGLSISIVSSPGSGNPGDDLTYTVEVKEDGSAASGKTVSFSITSGDGNASLNPASATTDTDGQASTTITLGQNASGSYTVTATVGSKSITGTATVNPPPTGVTISVVTAPGSGDPGDELTFTVEVQEDGSAASGKTVSFSITSGDGNASLNPTSSTTDTNGQASTTITLGNNASGIYMVTATVDSESVNGAATVTHPPAQISMSPSTVESPAVGQQLTFSINIKGGIDVMSYSTTVRFDSTALSYVSLTSGNYLSSSQINATSVTNDVLRHSGSLSLGEPRVGVDGDGTIATVTFTVLEVKDSTLSLSARLRDSSSQLIDETTTGATITSPTVSQTGLSISVVTSPGSGNPGDELTFSVEVQEDGSAASGKTVTFSITSGDANASLNPASATTDTDGQASTTITLGNNAAGIYIITATVDSESINGAAKVIPPPAELSLSPSSVESPAVGQQLTFSINIKGGIDVVSYTTTVRFDPTALSYVSLTSSNYLSSSQINSTSTTNDSVRHSGFLPLGEPRVGVDGDGTIATVTFTVLEVKDSTLSLTAGLSDTSVHTTEETTKGATITSPTVSQTGLSINVVTSPGSGNPGDELTFTVEVQEDGSAVSGKTVSFSITSGDGNASLNPASTTTDSNGQASTTITLGNNASGIYIVTATVDSESINGAAKATPPPPQISMSPSTVESPAVGQQLTFSINIKGGIDVKRFSTTVRFDPTALSYVSLTSGNYIGTSQSKITSTTNNSVRHSEFFLLDEGEAGVDGDGTLATVTFTVLEVKDSTLSLSARLRNSSSHEIDTTVEGAAITSPTETGLLISVVTSPGSGNPGDELTFTVEVQEDGSAASGKTVSFSITSGDGNASLNPASATTDTAGQASTTITLGDNASGSYAVTATVDSKSTTGTATVNPPPQGITISVVTAPGSGDPGDELTFTVEVQEDGSAASGKTVSFSITSGDGNASLSPASATTDTNGQASTTITLGANATGSYTVTATADATSTSGIATVNTTSPQIILSVVTAPGSGNPGDALTFTVEVQEDGNAASGKTVAFSITSGDGNASLSPASATTDTNGQASTTITLGNNASGIYIVTATVDSESVNGAATATPPPVELSLSPSTVESPAVGQQLTFSINIKGGIDVLSYRTIVRFDSTALSYVSLTSGNYLGSSQINTTSTTNDSVTHSGSLTLAEPRVGVDGDGTIATVTFTVLEVKDSTIRLSASLSNSSSRLIDKTTTGAAITSPMVSQTGLSISVVSSPGSGNPGDELTFTVEVQEDGNAASGKSVSFNITSGDGNASLSPASATTDTNGQASTTITLGNNASGIYIVTATVDSESVNGAATATPPPVELSLSPSTVESPAVGQQLTFSINIKGGIDVLSYTTIVRFDSTALSYVSLTSGNYLGSSQINTTSTTNDSVTHSGSLTLAEPRVGVDGDGTIATVTFTVLEVKDSTIRLSASLSNSSSRLIDKTTTGAAITSPMVSQTGLSISVVSSPGSGNPGDELTFTVEVQEDGNAASGKSVSFNITSGDGNASLSPASATTDTNGQASTTITLGNNASGIYIVTATVDSESVNGAATATPPPVELSLSPSTVESPAVGQQLTFSINIKGGIDVLSYRTIVRFDSTALSYVSLTSGNYLGSSQINTTSTTNDSVTHSGSLTLAEPRVGVDGDGTIATVTFTVLEVKDSTIRLSASLSNSSSRLIDKTTTGAAITSPMVSQTGLSISVVTSPGSGNPGDELTFTVRVQEDGSAASGKSVSFSITSGDGNASLNPSSATTGTNGQASTTLTLGNNAAGSYTVTAEVGTESVSAAATVQSAMTDQKKDNQQQPQAGLTISVVSSPGAGNPGDTLTFAVEVQADGSAASGKTVSFSITSGDSNASLNPESAATDSKGRASTTITLGENAAGSYRVTAAVGTETVSSTVTVETSTTTSPTPKTLAEVSGNNQSALTGKALANPFVVKILDQHDNLMEGVTVTFSVTAGGGSLSRTSLDTDADGLAKSTLALGSEPGTNTVTASVEGIAETVTFSAVAELLEFDLSVPSGTSLIHVPLKTRTVDGTTAAINSIADLYEALGGADTVKLLITYNRNTQQWNSYLGAGSKGGTADRALAADLGIVASLKSSVTVRIGGDQLGSGGTSTIGLIQGKNLIGLPLRDSMISRVSDLLTLDGIADNADAITVSVGGKFNTVEQTGDAGDISITGGQAFILDVSNDASVSISGAGWDNTPANTMAAPFLAAEDINVTETTPVLAMTGAIVHRVENINGKTLTVVVKNLSTGRTVTALIGDTGGVSSRADYQLTVVDIKHGRAAAIGDILKMSAVSADNSISAPPLRYTVTAEDIKLNRIQLPELIVQAIPKETQLLPNYPNPFNPETWIPYRLSKAAEVTLEIYDAAGNLVRTIDVGFKPAAAYDSRASAIYWDGRNNYGEPIASGVYFYHLFTDAFSAARKMLILK